jgi:hypothetical protein
VKLRINADDSDKNSDNSEKAWKLGKQEINASEVGMFCAFIAEFDLKCGFPGPNALF